MILFLDIDGVLVHRGSKASPSNPRVEDSCVKAVNKLIELMGVTCVVISSAWRHARPISELQSLLGSLTAPVVGITPDASRRGDEILQCLQQREPEALKQGEYVVVDDDVFDICPPLPATKVLHVKDGYAKRGLTTKMVEEYVAMRKTMEAYHVQHGTHKHGGSNA